MATKEEILNMQGSGTLYHVSVLDASKKPLKVRLSGKCQLWKTRPSEFRQPAKYGIYDYLYITQDNCNEWTTTAKETST